MEIEDEFLPEPFAGAELVACDDLAQGRQFGRRVGRGWSRRRAQAAEARLPARRAAISPASLRAAIRLVGLARPGPAMSKAEPWSGAVRMKGRPSVTLTPLSKSMGVSAMKARSGYMHM